MLARLGGKIKGPCSWHRLLSKAGNFSSFSFINLFIYWDVVIRKKEVLSSTIKEAFFLSQRTQSDSEQVSKWWTRLVIKIEELDFLDMLTVT